VIDRRVFKKLQFLAIANSGLHIVELLGGRGAFVFEPQCGTEPVEQTGAFLQNGASGREWGHIAFYRS
jgi:hypothetical protein